MKKSQTPSEQLRAWRAYCNLTIGQVAQYTGISETIIQAIEQGSLLPDVQMAERLNRFFAQYPALYQQNLQTQQVRTSYGAQSYPGGVTIPQPTQSYPGVVVQQPVQSYPGGVVVQQPVQSYPGGVVVQQPVQSYPGGVVVQQPVQSYPQQIYTAHVAPATVQQSRYFGQKSTQSSYSGISVRGAIIQIIMFIIPFIFLFFPFIDLVTGVQLSGVTVSGEKTTMMGAALLAYPHYEFSLAAVMIQIALWMTLVSGFAVIVLSVLRIFNLEFFGVRTVFFYIYLVGIIACLVGLSMASIDKVMHWASIAYTLSMVLALVCRIILDGGKRAFAVQR